MPGSDMTQTIHPDDNPLSRAELPSLFRRISPFSFSVAGTAIVSFALFPACCPESAPADAGKAVPVAPIRKAPLIPAPDSGSTIVAEDLWFVEDRMRTDVLQHQYAVTSSLSGRPLLETWNLGPCVSVVLDDRVNKVGALAHIDAGTPVAESIGEMISKMEARGACAANVSARLYSGWGFDLGDELIEALKARGVAIAEIDIVSPDGIRCLSVIYDVRSGLAMKKEGRFPERMNPAVREYLPDSFGQKLYCNSEPLSER